MSSLIIPSNLVLADRPGRLLAYLVDTALNMIAISPLIFSDELHMDETTLANVLLFGVLPLFTMQGYLLVKSGQTIGKKLLRIRIVMADTGEHPSWYRLLLLRSFLPAVLSLVPFFSTVNTLLIFQEDRRCLHDLIAGTKVVYM